MNSIPFGSVVLAVAAGLGNYAWQQQNSPADLGGDIAIAGSAIGVPFTLTSETGETITDADIITQPTYEYFGDVFCPDVCAIDSLRNGLATDKLAEHSVDVFTVFISVDPQRDTQKLVADHTDNFSPELIGQTSTAKQVRKAAQDYEYHSDAHNDDPEFYLVDHSTQTYLTIS